MPVQNALTAIMTLKDKTPNYDPKALVESLLRSQGVIVLGALQRLGFVHFARFCFIAVGNETKSAIITNYDFDFEDYMNVFIDELGALFDVMLQHVKDAPPTPVRQHRSEFIEHVREIDLTNPSKLKLIADPIDTRIVNWLADEFQRENAIDLRKDRQALQRLTEAAKKARIELSGTVETTISLPGITADANGPKDLEMRLTRAKFQELDADFAVVYSAYPDLSVQHIWKMREESYA